MTIEPIHKVVHVPLSVVAAFELFTDGISSWWPLSSQFGGRSRRTNGRLRTGYRRSYLRAQPRRGASSSEDA